MTVSDSPTLGYRELLRRNAPLRHLWLGRLVSHIGDWFNLIALYHAVQLLTDSAQAVVLVVVVKTLPIFLMTPLAGPIADRMDRRQLLIAADIFRALTLLALVACWWLDSLIGIYVCVTLMVCAAGIVIPTTNAALPMLTSPREVPMANALVGGTWSVSLALGAAVGGAVTEVAGVTVALLVDGGTFVVSAWLAARLPSLPPPALVEAQREACDEPAEASDQTGFREGLRYLWRSPYILCVASLKSLMQLYGGLMALTPFFGTIVFADASGPGYVGLLYGVRGVGAAIGAMGLRALFGDALRTMRLIIAVSIAMAGAAFATLALATAFWHAALAFFVAQIGQSAVYVLSGSLIQMEADERFHGRVFALDVGVMTLILAIASYLAGVALDHGVAMDTVVLVGASMAALPFAVWSATVWRVHRQSSTTLDDPGA